MTIKVLVVERAGDEVSDSEYVEFADPADVVQISSGLSARQERYCREYLIDGCGKRAYIRAGYAPGSAEVCASQLLRKPKVAARLAELQAEQARRLAFSADRVLVELIPLCMSNIGDLIGEDGRFVEDLSKLPSEVTAAIQSYRVVRKPNGYESVTIKFWNKISALALAGKHRNVQAFTKPVNDADRDPIVIRAVRSVERPR